MLLWQGYRLSSWVYQHIPNYHVLIMRDALHLIVGAISIKAYRLSEVVALLYCHRIFHESEYIL